MIDIKELARLWLLTQVKFGQCKPDAFGNFEKAFNEYHAGHEHLVAAYPDPEFREMQLNSTVRAVARQILKEEGKCDVADPESP